MSYQITYDKEKRKTRKSRSFLVPMILAAWIGFLVLVNSHWQEGKAVLNRFLIPEVTAEAFQSFVSDLRSGTAFPKALESFCYEVVQGVD